MQQSDTPVSEIARNLGINDNLLRKWGKQSTEPGQRALPGHGNPRDKEVARLQRELRQVKEERVLLRETAVFFVSNGMDSSSPYQFDVFAPE